MLRPISRLIGFALVILGLAVLFEDLFGFSLGIDFGTTNTVVAIAAALAAIA